MDPMIKNSFFTIFINWNDNRIHLGLTKKLIFFILFPPLFKGGKRKWDCMNWAGSKFQVDPTKNISIGRKKHGEGGSEVHGQSMSNKEDFFLRKCIP